MPLHFAVPPPDSVAQLVGSLARDASGPIGLTASRSSLPPASQTSPHPVFALGLDDLAAGAGVEAARLVAWRYLLEADGGEWAAAEVYQVDQGTHRWGALNRGKHVKGTLDELRTASADSRFAGIDYSVQLLRIPALSLGFLWLKAPEGTDDVFIPIAPTFPPFTVAQTYSGAELELLLKPLATERLKFDDTPRKAPGT